MQKSQSKDTAELLQLFPLFEGVEANELEYLAARAEFTKFKKHDTIYQSGERSDCLLFLIKGVVKIGRYSSDGREIIKHVLHPMSMFGELCLAGELKRKDFAVAIKKDTQILKIGTSRQTVTSVMNDLRKANLIYFNRRTILIRDLGRLS